MSAADPLKEFELQMLAEHHESEHEFCRILHDHLMRAITQGRRGREAANAALLNEYVQLMAHHFMLAQHYREQMQAARLMGFMDSLSS